MTAARSLSEVTTGTTSKRARSFQPVRANSVYADDRRALGMWKPIDRKKWSIAKRIGAAEKYDRDHRQQGEKMGPLGHIGLEVLRALYMIVDYKTGRLEPSIDYICGKVKRSRAAVVRALARLRDHGFLKWKRRAEPIEGAEGLRGPQVKQIPNAYGLDLPVEAISYLTSRDGPSVPACEEDRHAAHAAEKEEMVDTLPLAEVPSAYVEDNALREILARMGSSLSASNANSHKSQNPDTKGN